MPHNLDDSNIAQSRATLDLTPSGKISVLGNWTADHLVKHKPDVPSGLPPIDLNKTNQLLFDLSALSELDTFGAAALAEICDQLGKNGHKIELTGGHPRHIALLKKLFELNESEVLEKAKPRNLPIDTLGRLVVDAGQDSLDFVAVQGRIFVLFFKMLTFHAPIRFASIVNQFHEIILRAIPIVILISLVVGVILTQQTIEQLKSFGAIIFVVDLSSILMLREIGILLAAIMVAGRSGSAITAEIGAMKMREEIDALEVMGLDTYRAVVMPRVIALITGLPALGLIGAIAGILGAALAARATGGIALDVFLARLKDAVDLQSIMVGLVKAPLMALAIAIIAVQEGLQVSGSTQSLGRHTTASVVKSIFIVILLDGIFAVYFGAIGF